jgi:NADH-quinone oxidoreductase subunit L
MPFFAGYYSKDIILEAAFASGSKVGMFAFVMGCLAALMTAFYSWRLLFMTFHGKPRASHDVMHHVHESPAIMLLPLLLLAGGALASGYIGHDIFKMVEPEGAFWGSAIASSEEKTEVNVMTKGHDGRHVEVTVENNNKVLEKAEHIPHIISLLPTLIGVFGILLSWLFYIAKPTIPAKLAATFKPLYLFLYNKWYFDELYDAIFVRPAKSLGNYLWQFVDTKIVDGLGPNGVAWISSYMAKRASRLQTGYMYHYAFSMLIGLIIIVGCVLYMAGRN